MTKGNILIIDDELQIRKLLQLTLEHSGYTVSQASNGKEGLILAANHPPDLILLDIGLPDINGHNLLVELKEWYPKPIIILSAHNTEQDIVAALDNGAADYLSKPFRTAELLARIRACIRRNQNENVSTVINYGSLQIDFVARTVKKGSEYLKLTYTEYQLLNLFVHNEGRVLTHQYILKEIWGVGYQSETQYLRVFIATLRKKIEDNPTKPEYIVTENGIGYRFG